MKSNDEKTSVIFRVFKNGGDVIALFPYENYHGDFDDGTVMSYQHIGQHGGASYGHCLAITRPATEVEYSPLKRELESIGYVLEVKKRKQSKYSRSGGAK